MLVGMLSTMRRTVLFIFMSVQVGNQTNVFISCKNHVLPFVIAFPRSKVMRPPTFVEGYEKSVRLSSIRAVVRPRERKHTRSSDLS